LNFGADIGGYRDVKGIDHGREKALLIRWA